MAMTEEQKKAASERIKAQNAAKKAEKEAAAKAKDLAENTGNQDNALENQVNAAGNSVEEKTTSNEGNSGDNEEPKNADSGDNSQKEETTGKKLYSEEEVQALAAEIAKKATEEALAKAQPMRIYASPSDEIVTVLFISEVSEKSILLIPGYGSLTPGSTLDVPKKEFGGQFMSPLVRKLISKREMLVLSGLNEDERVRWGVDYKDGEVMDIRTFDRMLDFDTDKLAGVFDKLCVEHQRFIARRFITAYERGDNRISIEKVKAVNDLSKKNDPDGMFLPIINGFKNAL